MGRRIDWNLKTKRDGCTAALAIARNYTSMMTDKCAELQGLTVATVSGHPVGDRMVSHTARSVDALAQACTKLSEAAAAARAIDVTVDDPDGPDEG